MTKTRRQTLILELVDREVLTSQEMLQRRLKARGVSATQATISRDLKELGLVKRAGDGAYGRPGQDTTSPGDDAGPPAAGRRPIAVADGAGRPVRRAPHAARRGTAPGARHRPCGFSRRGRDHRGDDTVLVIATGPKQAAAFLEQLETTR